MKKIALIALGGNAIIKRGERITVSKQFANTEKSLECVLPLLTKGYSIVITHGNGPQVGNILIRVEEALGKAYKLPLDVCVAESEGEMGYMIEQSLFNLLNKNKIKKGIAGILTQVLVDKSDRAFKNPTKPIGPFLNKKQADLLRKKKKHVVKVDTKYRRVVPSPYPKKILESKIIKQLMQNNTIVITAGGGGIPVVQNIKKEKKLMGIEAVIDKDLASMCLANEINANLFLILTDVDCVYLNYRTKKQKPLRKLTINQAKKYLLEGQFPPGSMGQKIQAAIEFIEKGKIKRRKVIITNPENVKKALQNKAGTLIVK